MKSSSRRDNRQDTTHRILPFIIPLLMLGMLSCSERRQADTTPWGTTLEQGEGEATHGGKSLPLDDIVANGELIMATLSGPETYYDYHNYGMGLQYLLCEKFAQSLGVSLRVDVCRDTAEMIRKVERGEADVVAFQLPRSCRGLRFCGASIGSSNTQWAVGKDNSSLAKALNDWFRPEMVAQTRKEENFLLSAGSVERHVYTPMLNRGAGIISRFDAYFQQYAQTARMDWRLLAAQCYQESCFDPRARSWAGARGLMQIMPATAAHLGLPEESVYNPQENIEAGARFLGQLQSLFSDIPQSQRANFVLASYNGGSRHIRDAMSLTKKYGGNPYNWNEVSQYVLKLTDPKYYQDPVAPHGYMRGNETVEYVRRIQSRYAQYCGFAAPGSFASQGMPQRARKHHRFK